MECVAAGSPSRAGCKRAHLWQLHPIHAAVHRGSGLYAGEFDNPTVDGVQGRREQLALPCLFVAHLITPQYRIVKHIHRAWTGNRRQRYTMLKTTSISLREHAQEGVQEGGQG